MNPQYIQQNQQQQQQPGYYQGSQTSPPYGELNSNVPPTMLKQPPLGTQGPPPANMHQMQPLYYGNNTQSLSPSTMPQTDLINRMSNVSLGNQQRPPPPPTTQSFPLLPPTQQAKNNSPNVMQPMNVNGFNSSLDPPHPGAELPPGPPDTGLGSGIRNNQPDARQNMPASLDGQRNMPPTMVENQRNLAQTLPGQPSASAPLENQRIMPPLFDNQRNVQNMPTPLLTGPQNVPAPLESQRNLQNVAMPTDRQNITAPPMDSQKNMGPSYQAPNMSGSMDRQNMSAPPLKMPAPLDNQKNLPGQLQPNLTSSPMPQPQNYAGSPLGQQQMPQPMQQRHQNFPAPPTSTAMGPQQYPPGGQNMAPSMQSRNLVRVPPMPPTQQPMPPGGQVAPPQGVSPIQSQPGQNYSQLPPPPPPGQPVMSPTGYQHSGYQQPQPAYPNQDMYGTQRNMYQGGATGAGSLGGYQPPGGMQSQQARRLDPEQMPSSIQVMQDDQRVRGGVFVTNQRGLVPPLVATKFVTQDQGNCSPRYIRSTMYTVPTTADIIKQTNVPFGLVISPMARIVKGEFEPPIINMGEIGPVRCVRCKAYMSPFMQFVDAGRRFQCMFCKATTEVPAEYFQHLDHTGQRMDRYERPELMLGTYEYHATKDYCRHNKIPEPPAIVFVIDVSYNTVKSGLVNLLCSRMKSILKNLPIDAGATKSNIRVGFITYSNTVHFYNINPCLAQPQMMVVGDVQDVFMPLLDGFLCDVEKGEAIIDSLMAQIPEMFADTRETETILAPAIQAGLQALKTSGCAGKLMVFHSSLPIADAPGKLKNRDDRKLLGTDKEKTVLAPQNNVYNNLGQDCVAAGCSVDMFIFNNSYVDLATIGQVCRLTGGEVNKYTYFQADIDGERMITDVMSNISRSIAFDAIMRVRTSTGVRATDFHGHFFMSNTTDMELASIDCNKAVAIEIKHDDKLTDDEGVYIQVALLYTSCGGVRRLRIMNLSLKTSSQMAELYRACDLDALINFFLKQSVFKLVESTPKIVKDSLISRSASILAAYRKHCASPSSAGQLILPECMKLLPLYINCLLKSDAISGGADMLIDDRSFAMFAVSTMPTWISVVYTYPRLLPLHDIDPQETELPTMLRCSIDKFADDGAYLLENSMYMFLWVGHSLSPHWVQAVFGVPSVMQIDTDRTTLPTLDNTLNKRVSDIINRVRVERQRCMRLTIVRQREKMEAVLRHFLVEDRGNDGSATYVDFLCHMHKEIRLLLSQ